MQWRKRTTPRPRTRGGASKSGESSFLYYVVLVVVGGVGLLGLKALGVHLPTHGGGGRGLLVLGALALGAAVAAVAGVAWLVMRAFQAVAGAAGRSRRWRHRG